MVYHRIQNMALCAMQWDLVFYPFHIHIQLTSLLKLVLELYRRLGTGGRIHRGPANEDEGLRLHNEFSHTGNVIPSHHLPDTTWDFMVLMIVWWIPSLRTKH